MARAANSEAPAFRIRTAWRWVSLMFLKGTGFSPYGKPSKTRPGFSP